MSPAELLERLRRYSDELRLCALLGADPGSRWQLMRDTLLFHLLNGLKLNSGNGRVRSYRVTLSGQTQLLHLRRRSGDFFVLHEVLLGECYFLPQPWRPSPRTIVDLGANIGITSLFFRRYAPDAHFVCVEPHPQNVAMLRANLATMKQQTTVVEGAVSNQSGTVFITVDRPSWGGEVQTNGGMPVTAYTVEQILAHCPGPIDILKIDIEGSEAALFDGDCNWLDRVHLIIIELHGAAAETNFYRAMDRAGFTVIPQDSPFGNRMLCAIREA